MVPSACGYNSTKTTGLPSVIRLSAKGENPDEKVREFLRELMRTGLGKYKFNSEQVRYYADQFDKLAVRAKATVGMVEGIQKA
jgi:hypothetical protein